MKKHLINTEKTQLLTKTKISIKDHNLLIYNINEKTNLINTIKTQLLTKN